MKKIYIKIFLFITIIASATTGCQKEEMTPVNKEETQLSQEKIELKKNMDKAAQVLAKFSNDKKVWSEVQKMIDLQMYNDDYVKFKDLFQPESNSKLKSFGETKFARRFRETVSSGLKSRDSFDLETFLTENNLVLYIPYPVEDYPVDKQVPTISYHPLDNDSVNIGYRLTGNKSTNNVTTVPKVNETYSKAYPVLIIAPPDELGGGGNTGGGNTGGGTGNNSVVVRLEEMMLARHYEAFFNGGSEVQVIFADGIEIDDKNNPAGVNIHYNAQHFVSRRDVRNKNWKSINIVLDPDWKQNELQNYFAAVEIDNTGKVKFTASVEIKTKFGTFTPTIDLEYTSTNDFIGYRELTRDYFMNSQTNPIYYGLTTRNGLPIRKCGELSFTTKTINY